MQEHNDHLTKDFNRVKELKVFKLVFTSLHTLISMHPIALSDWTMFIFVFYITPQHTTPHHPHHNRQPAQELSMADQERVVAERALDVDALRQNVQVKTSTRG